MQRIQWVHKRLESWALWRSASSGGYSSPAFEYVEHSRTSYQFVEINADMEAGALAIDQALAALPDELGNVVVAHYTWGGGMSQIEEKFRITRATVHRRLCHADLRIASWLDTQKALNVSRRKSYLV